MCLQSLSSLVTDVYTLKYGTNLSKYGTNLSEIHLPPSFSLHIHFLLLKATPAKYRDMIFERLSDPPTDVVPQA